MFSKDNDVRAMGKWINRLQKMQKKRTEIMKSNEVYNKWLNLLNNMRNLFMRNSGT